MKISKILTVCLIAMGLGAFGGTARATVVTFNSDTAGECLGVPKPFTSGGMVFNTAANQLCVNSGTPTSNGLRFAWNGTNTLGFVDFPDPNGTFVMTRVGGAAFTLNSFDAAEFFKMTDGSAAFNAESLSLIGTHADASTVSTTITLNGVNDGVGGLADYQTFNFAALFTNLVSLTLSSNNGSDNGYFMLDNITYDEVIAGVPAPGALALLGLGLFGIGGLRRKVTSLPCLERK